jgi:hypothetical protein
MRKSHAVVVLILAAVVAGLSFVVQGTRNPAPAGGTAVHAHRHPRRHAWRHGERHYRHGTHPERARQHVAQIALDLDLLRQRSDEKPQVMAVYQQRLVRKHFHAASAREQRISTLLDRVAGLGEATYKQERSALALNIFQEMRRSIPDAQ